MPVKSFVIRPVTPNPKLSVGQVYRITGKDNPSAYNRRAGSYFSVIPTQNLLVYLASSPEYRWL